MRFLTVPWCLFRECTNLLAPVCVSGTHLTYASIRMEPQYMVMGHAAGVAAAKASKNQVPVQQVDIGGLKRKLVSQEQILTLQENLNGVSGNEREVVVDDDMARFVDLLTSRFLLEGPLTQKNDRWISRLVCKVTWNYCYNCNLHRITQSPSSYFSVCYPWYSQLNTAILLQFLQVYERCRLTCRCISDMQITL